MGHLLAGKAWAKVGTGDLVSSRIDLAAKTVVFYIGGGSNGTTGHFSLCTDLFVSLTHSIGLLQAN